jgi:hypothetical protein
MDEHFWLGVCVILELLGAILTKNNSVYNPTISFLLDIKRLKNVFKLQNSLMK